MTTNQENWIAKYTAIREHVAAYGHLTDRHTQLKHKWKYQKKKRKEGKLTEEQCRLLDELYSLRSTQMSIQEEGVKRLNDYGKEVKRFVSWTKADV